MLPYLLCTVLTRANAAKPSEKPEAADATIIKHTMTRKTPDPMVAQHVPAFLAPRRGRKAAKVQSAEPAPGDASIHSQIASEAAKPATDSQIASEAQSSVRKADTRRGRGKGKVAEGEGALQSVQPAAPSVIVATVRQMASRPELVDQFEAIQPGAIHGAAKAMLGGAVVAGAHGAADRASLWRILGMPWVGEAGNAKQAGTLLGAALGEAVARLEDHRGHKGVTVDMRSDAKVLATQGE